MENKSWMISKLEKIIEPDTYYDEEMHSNVNRNSKKLYNESIILIGPSGAGKSTIAEELRKKTRMQRLCLDRIANRARDTGFMRKFKNADEFNSYMISEIIERAKKDDLFYYYLIKMKKKH